MNTTQLIELTRKNRKHTKLTSLQIKIIEFMVIAYDNKCGLHCIDLIEFIYGKGNAAFNLVKRRVLMKHIEMLNARGEGWGIGHYNGSTKLFLNFGVYNVIGETVQQNKG